MKHAKFEAGPDGVGPDPGGRLFQPTRESSATPLPAVITSNSEYRIGPGDTLQVFVWNQPELTVTVPVRPDGMISTPLIEGVPAEGKTAASWRGTSRRRCRSSCATRKSA